MRATEPSACPECGGVLQRASLWLGGPERRQLVAVDCQNCAHANWFESLVRPEDLASEVDLARQIMALLRPETRDLAGIRRVLGAGRSQGYGPWDIYHAAVKACPEAWAPFPEWPIVAPRSPLSDVTAVNPPL
jgi:hypothetical protein